MVIMGLNYNPKYGYNFFNLPGEEPEMILLSTGLLYYINFQHQLLLTDTSSKSSSAT